MRGAQSAPGSADPDPHSYFNTPEIQNPVVFKHLISLEETSIPELLSLLGKLMSNFILLGNELHSDTTPSLDKYWP
jgi:hypothetical protein